MSNIDKPTLLSGPIKDIAAVTGSVPTSWRHRQRLSTLLITVIGLGLASALTFIQGALAQQNAVTATSRSNPTQR